MTKDKNYWLKRWYERRFLNKLWELIPDGETSWMDVMHYIRSGRFEEDLYNDISYLAAEELAERECHD